MTQQLSAACVVEDATVWWRLGGLDVASTTLRDEPGAVTRRMRSGVLAFLSVVGFVRVARAGEETMPEPVLQENITDIDAVDVGAIEFDLTPAYLRAQHSQAGLWTTGLEAEWRPIDRLGLGAEISVSGALDGGRFIAPVEVTPRASASYVVLRDLTRKVFLQIEASARYNGLRELALVDPTELVLPYSFGVRGAALLGPLNLRVSALGEAGGAFVHAPLNTGMAVLLPFEGHAHAAIGVEGIADWARTYPVLVAPEAQCLARPFGRPIRLQIALPFTVGARGADATFGINFRFVLEPDE